MRRQIGSGGTKTDDRLGAQTHSPSRDGSDGREQIETSSRGGHKAVHGSVFQHLHRTAPAVAPAA